MRDSSLSIFLCDLFHSQVAHQTSVPLNLGYLASALDKTFSDQVSMQLFKYPENLSRALQSTAPDLVALSNYTWSEALSLHYARVIKEKYPQAIIVMGGPNIRVSDIAIREFLTAHPYVDAYIPLEAEFTLCELVQKIIDNDRPDSISEVYQRVGPIEGCYLSVEDYAFDFSPVRKDSPNLQYGSPYLGGFLDAFIRDPRLIPIFETNRGCPYSCTFCSWGISALGKLKRRETDEILAEFDYVADNSCGQDYWYFADANFGILERDVELALALRNLKDTKGVPKRLDLNWAKNSGERMLRMVGILKDMVPGQIAVQSFDPEVLASIKRKNLKNDMVSELIEAYHNQNLTVSTDLLVGCSNESFESHLETLRQAFSLRYDNFNINNIRMLPGAEIDTPEDREKYGFNTKFRFIPGSYGMYEGTFVYEIEEAIKSSITMKESEMNDLRAVHFLVYILWNSTFARHLLNLGSDFGINPLDVMLEINADSSAPFSREILLPLSDEYEQEWFATREELVDFYSDPKIAEQMVSGKPVQKLMWKYVARCLSKTELIQGLIRHVSAVIDKRTAVSSCLLQTATQVCLDRLKLDVVDADSLSKVRHYPCDRSTYEYLTSNSVIPDETPYTNGGFDLIFAYKREHFDYLHRSLSLYHYDENQEDALCAALSNGMIRYFHYHFGSYPTEAPQRVSKPFAQA